MFLKNRHSVSGALSFLTPSCLSCLSVCMSVCLSASFVRPSVCLSVCQSASFVCPVWSTCVAIYMSVCACLASPLLSFLSFRTPAFAARDTATRAIVALDHQGYPLSAPLGGWEVAVSLINVNFAQSLSANLTDLPALFHNGEAIRCSWYASRHQENGRPQQSRETSFHVRSLLPKQKLVMSVVVPTTPSRIQVQELLFHFLDAFN